MKPERDEIKFFRKVFPRLASLVEQCESNDLNKVKMPGHDRMMIKSHMPIHEHSPFWLARIEIIKRHFNARSLEELNTRLERIADGIDKMLKTKNTEI